MGILLFIVAVILFIIFGILALAYVIYKIIDNALYAIAEGIDRGGNVLLADFLNDWAVVEDGYQYGNKNDTISKVLGINKRLGKDKKLGKFLCRVLNFIDKDHVEKASQKYFEQNNTLTNETLLK